jgi:hypothetical protein
MHKELLDRSLSSDASVFQSGIPVRISVHALSKYAPFKNWFFDEAMELKNTNPPYSVVETYEITQHGEEKRPADELQRIAELKKKDEERKLLLI